MTKVSDYIFNYLSSIGLTEVFMISGGGAMFLVDSLGKHPNINYICPHHEQASAIAAEGYARVSNKPGVVVVTSGPGGTNTLTGVIGQWLDSIPALYLSGQVKFSTTIESCPEVGLRQLGDQEINIIDIVKPVTKYSHMVTNEQDIAFHLEKALYLASEGRPGPVWLDIPLNIQNADINIKSLNHFNPPKKQKLQFQDKLDELIMLLKNSKRPLLVPGHGIHLADAKDDLFKLLYKARIPSVATFNAIDLLPTAHPLLVGKIGSVGDRPGNIALQNADLIITIGTRNNIRQISYNWENFARSGKLVIVDIDDAELNKPTINPHLAIHADASDFLKAFIDSIPEKNMAWPEWEAWCMERKAKLPVVLESFKQEKDYVNPYYFAQQLTSKLKDKAIVVAGNGTACVTLFQAGIIKKNQRVFWNSGCASMGYDLPAAIGASIANKNADIICVAGDGSLQMNIQELQTAVYHKLPIKIFVLNNSGYCSIKQTQDNFFNGRRAGCCDKSGVGFPEIKKISTAYDIPYFKIESHNSLNNLIEKAINTKGPVLIEVILPPDYIFQPKLSSDKKPDGTIVSKPLEDMYPFLERKTLKENMIVPLIDE